MTESFDQIQYESHRLLYMSFYKEMERRKQFFSKNIYIVDYMKLRFLYINDIEVSFLVEICIMNNLNAQKLLWEQQIKNEYPKYQVFINNTNMPKYKVNFVDSTKTKISYSMEALIYKRPVILNINIGFMINGKNKYCQPTLYHEFTHMWDSENLFKDKELQERKTVLSLYTEYHAAQIGFLRFMEFESVNHTKNINSNDRFFEFDKQETVFEYYDERCKLLSESINAYNLNASTNNYKAILDSYMYVFGVKSMYDKYIGIVELPKVSSIFHKNLMDIYPLLQNYKVEELWEILLNCSKILDNLHILNSIEYE